MADDKQLTETEGARTIYGLEIKWKAQEPNDGSDGPLDGKNGNPNEDSNWDKANEDYIGIDVGAVRDGVFFLEPPDGEAMDLELWINWSGRDSFAYVQGSAEKFEGLDKITTDEVRLRGADFVYFRRVDDAGGEWAARIGELN